MSPIKEPNFFSRDIDTSLFRADYKLHERQKRLDVAEYVRGDMSLKHWGAYVQEPSHYLALFRNATPGQLRGEISNSYLYSKVAAEEIARRSPDSRLFMILRNPVDRAFSHYRANVRDGRSVLPFMQEIESDAAVAERGWGRCHLYLDLGLYAEQVARFTRLFDATQLRIYLYEDLASDPAALARDLYRFVGVDAEGLGAAPFRENEARVPKFPWLIYQASRLGLKKPLFRLVPPVFRDAVKSRFFRPAAAESMGPEDRCRLQSYFREDILNLQDLLGRDLSHWFTTEPEASR